ncbi:EscV/YscV/HrcV family type III secretion system export apparatus protein [Hahella sp. CCB-MM4]|nr:EscV/YscV/HrcV family type III secretion system export apparatus protein [Hahella sp. CCB-MM4]
MSGQYSDFVLAFGVVAIVGLMILPLPHVVIDILVAVNILIAVGLLLLSIYVPSPLAFASFPSVILLSTLFRLSLSIAITRLILLEADAGDIIDTFGNMVVGGNLVVGIVVFIIITVVQFIVIAKGAERVAEVAARFTLDAMPGKQLSIDSDLRAGLIDKDDAKKKRRMLERESQLHGSLDGAMKFVKGDAIAGIVILIVNILGGLTVGVIQNDMSFGEAVHTYSILTIGDGLVSQVPALLTSIAAGLIITRTGSDESERHLGSAIGKQFGAFPRVFLIGGILSLLLMTIPGFPWPVFLVLGLLLLGWTIWKNPSPIVLRWFPGFAKAASSEAQSETDHSNDIRAIEPLAPVALSASKDLLDTLGASAVSLELNRVIGELRDNYGVPVPAAVIQEDRQLPAGGYQLESYGVRLARGQLELEKSYALEQDALQIPARLLSSDQVPDPSGSDMTADQLAGQSAAFIPEMPGRWQKETAENIDSRRLLTPMELLAIHCRTALIRYLPMFMGIQEASNMVNQWAQAYPDLIKETLRVVPPQRLTEILKRLLKEGISIRNLRDVFEAIADAGTREKDLIMLTELVRQALKQQISHHHTDDQHRLRAVLIHPDLEDQVRQICRNIQPAQPVSLPPDVYAQITESLKGFISQSHKFPKPIVLLCNADIRRQFRQLLEDDFHLLPVLAYQELVGNVQILPLGHLSQ